MGAAGENELLAYCLKVHVLKWYIYKIAILYLLFLFYWIDLQVDAHLRSKSILLILSGLASSDPPIMLVVYAHILNISCSISH